MVKRKAELSNGNASTQQSKKVKKLSESNVSESYGKINCTDPDSTLNSLLGKENAKVFFSEYWEKKHFFVQRKNSKYYGTIFSLDTIYNIINEQQLEFESDINVCRFVDGEKELLNEKGCKYVAKKGKENDCEGMVNKSAFERLMKEDKATFQFHQPQRFSDHLWNIMEKLETRFGSLFGSNAYLTPSSAQGLAPHCDDVEIFVLQLEGKKTWKLYEPMVKLSRDYTQDLNEEDIGKPFFEQTLEPGDLLYFPRGTIHQAKTTDGGHSLHLSISTYQMNTWGDMMNHAVTQAIENALEDDVEVRSGLPINYLSYLGTGKDLGKYVELEKDETRKIEISTNLKDTRVVDFKEKIKAKLSSLIDHIDVNTAADAMSIDFVMNRLPPYRLKHAESDEIGHKVPTLQDKIRIKHRDHVRIVYSNGEEEDNEDFSQLEEDDESEMEDDEDEKPAPKKIDKKTPTKKEKAEAENDDDDDDDDAEPGDEEPCIQIIHSLNNPRESHMIGKVLREQQGVLKLPIHFGHAAVALLESDDFIKVKSIALEDDDDKLHLATILYADGLIDLA